MIVAAAREVVDRLEQRHDVDGERARRCSSPTSFSSTPTSRRSRHRLALRDHVVRQRRRAESAVDVRSRARGSRARMRARARIVEMRRAQQPRPGELAREQRDALGLGERRVVGDTPARASSSPTTASCTSAFWRRSSDRQVEAEDVDGAHAAARAVRAASGAAPCAASERAITSRSASSSAGRRVRRERRVRRSRAARSRRARARVAARRA